ncbi:MAG: EAL domain-containing protein [Lachnospiraceae bacterium]|nr:EAL domain-containing protein [Lachnospiraceae bacterium]
MSAREKKLTMLVADDSLPNRVLLSDAFKSEYEILLAENGAEAMELLRLHDDIVIAIIDLMMPGTDGFKVISNINSIDRNEKIPVIAITGSENPADEIHAVDLGAMDVVHKPVNVELLKHKVRNLITFTALTAGGSERLMRLLIEHTEVDEKTGLFNKVAFCNAVRRYIDSDPNNKYVIIRWDVDGFKVFNDVYGVAEGDRFLRNMGEYLGKYASEDFIFGRWSADHFVACLKLENFDCDRMVQLVDEASGKDDFGFEIVIRMGVYIVDEPQIDVALMCDRALLALRTIKGDYTKRVAFYDDEMRASLIEAQQITNDMENALAEGQFFIYLQPQINYDNGSLHGAEALVRWRHPRKGIIQPAKFIPVFEKNGFITHLDMFVWEEACKLVRRWLDKGIKPVPISVNVSRIDIYSLRLKEHFDSLIEKYDLNPSLIRVEITESAYIDSPAHLINSVEKLREAGYMVEMDDFGSGYSSLNTLKDVPFDLLKLDMRFIDDNSATSKGGSILSSVVSMSRRLNLPVLAEGVETKVQADYLKSIGCVYMQGYYFSKPIPVSEFEKILMANEAEEPFTVHSREDENAALGFLNASTQYTLLFNSFVGGAAIVEYDGERVEALRINDRFYEDLGIKREDFADKSVSLLDYLDKTNGDKFVASLEKAVINETDDCEVNVKYSEEQNLWMKVRVKLLVSIRGRHLFYLNVENITQKMNLLLRNLQLSEKLNGIMNSVPGGIIDFEAGISGGSIKYVNNTVTEMFGFTAQEYINMVNGSFAEIVHEDDYANVRSIQEELVSGRSDSGEISFRHLCKDGTYKWVDFSIAVVKRTDYGFIGSGIMLDFDYQVRFEQNALETKRNFEKKLALSTALISCVPCGVLQYAKRGSDFRLFSCNEAAWTYLDFKDKTALMDEFGKCGYMIPVHPDDDAKLKNMVGNILKRDTESVEEERLYVRNGSGGYTPAVVRVQRVDYDGEQEYIQYILMF